jgi:hypothetical protein
MFITDVRTSDLDPRILASDEPDFSRLQMPIRAGTAQACSGLRLV